MRARVVAVILAAQSTPISNSEFGAEHNCSFWRSIAGAIGGGS